MVLEINIVLLLFCYDNVGAVHAINKGTWKSPDVMKLVRYLTIIAATNSYKFAAQYLRSEDNGICGLSLTLPDGEISSPGSQSRTYPVTGSIGRRIYLKWCNKKYMSWRNYVTSYETGPSGRDVWSRMR